MVKAKDITRAGEMLHYRLRLGYDQKQMGALMSMSRGNYARMECGLYGMRDYHIRTLRMLRFLERKGLLEEFAKDIFREWGV